MSVQAMTKVSGVGFREEPVRWHSRPRMRPFSRETKGLLVKLGKSSALRRSHESCRRWPCGGLFCNTTLRLHVRKGGDGLLACLCSVSGRNVVTAHDRSGKSEHVEIGDAVSCHLSSRLLCFTSAVYGPDFASKNSGQTQDNYITETWLVFHCIYEKKLTAHFGSAGITEN
jgi:hypothetical protein